MTRVPWSALDGLLVEDLVAALVLLGRATGNQITPSRGDRGIDVREDWDGKVRVTQIKKYTAPLTGSQKREIEASWATFLAKGKPTVGHVDSWILAMPCDPTNETKEWFDNLTGGADFPAYWLGLNQLDTLAGERPDIVNYYLGDGKDRALDLMSEALRGSAPLPEGPSGENLLGAIVERHRHLAHALQDLDPFYRYEVDVRSGPMPPPDANLPEMDLRAVFVTYMQVDTDQHVVIRIHPKSALSVWLQPISRTIEFDVEPGSDEYKALERFQRYGAPATDIPATTIHATGPPGTTRTGAGSISMFQVGASIDGLELRLLAEASGSTQEDCSVIQALPLMNQQVGSGLTEGSRIAATDPSGVLAIEALFGYGADTLNMTISGWVGKPIRTVLPLFELLAAATAGTRFGVGVNGGPLLVGYDPVIDHFGPDEDQLGWLGVLATIQEHTLQTVIIPRDPTPDQVNSAIRVAAMLDGHCLRGRDEPFTSTVNDPQQIVLGEVQGAMFRSPMTVTLEDTVYNPNRSELVFFRHLTIEPVTTGRPVRAGDTIRLIPSEPAAVLAVAPTWRPGDPHPAIRDE